MYNPATDFLGLWRNAGGNVSKGEIPGLDFMIAALARAGLIVVSVSATAPVANQATTAWLQAAVPSFSGEGVFYLWDATATAYAPATPKLFRDFLLASSSASGVSWFAVSGGAPSNTIGANGDFAIRTDNPGGIYGPKAAGAWPPTPIPGTTNEVSSLALDNAFGATPGNILYRALGGWQSLPIGLSEQLLVSFDNGTNVLPAWHDLSLVLDRWFGATRGSILFRGAAVWQELAPGPDNFVLTTHDVGNDPTWSVKASEFASGTTMLFRQTAAPTGWTKRTDIDDYALRVTSGAITTVARNPFSAVFGQTTTQGHVLTINEIPSHSHPLGGAGTVALAATGNIVSNSSPGGSFGTAGISIGNTGLGAAHAHDFNTQVSYCDVIIATKN